MKHILYILILFALINCSEDKHSSEIQKTTNDSTSNVEDHKEITKDSINYKKSKIDSLEEFKLVIKKAYETNPIDWIKESVIHPDLGLSILSTPGVHISVEYIKTTAELTKLNGYPSLLDIKSDLEGLYMNIEHPKFQELIKRSNYYAETLGGVKWGHGAFNIYAPEQRLGYLVLDHIYDDYSDFVRIDSLFYFLASKGLTDASHVNNESDFFNDELLRNQLITVISNTNSENLDRFIESIIKKKPNYELITGKGGQKHDIGEFIIYGSGPYIDFLRIDGKLYLYSVDYNDSYDQHF